jgi:hypothetical protein
MADRLADVADVEARGWQSHREDKVDYFLFLGILCELSQKTGASVGDEIKINAHRGFAISAFCSYDGHNACLQVSNIKLRDRPVSHQDTSPAAPPPTACHS